MSFVLADVLKTIGGSASIVFAAWIFMGFLQQRYDMALERYRAAVGDYRSAKLSNERRENVRDQILVYKRRCELMNYSLLSGLTSAVLLITTLIGGELDIIFPNTPALKYLSAGCALLGFVLVITAAVLVILEALITHRQLDDELLDVPELAESTGQRPGFITDGNRKPV